MDVLNSRLKSAEEIKYELENRSNKLILFSFKTYNNRYYKMEKLERLREIWDRLKSTNIDQRIQKREVERLKEIMAENFPELMTDMTPQILEAT